MTRITTVFFDLGSTLVYSRYPWPPYYEKADQSVARALADAGLDIDPEAFPAELGGFIRSYYETPAKDNIERTTFAVLRDLLAGKGFRDVPEATLRQALRALYSVTQQNWFAEDDAILTLETLQSRGYHIGLISNTSDDNNIQAIVDRWGFRPYLEYVITSAACGIRKPDERIFRLALDHFGVPPEAAAMVGDTPDADILGANRLGMYSIWVTRRTTRKTADPARPDATTRILKRIPSILSKA